MTIERITGSPAITLTFEEERQEISPTKVAIRNESVTGRIYSYTAKVRRSWNITSHFTNAEKESLLSLASDHYVKAVIGGVTYYCVFEIRSIQVIETWSTNHLYRADLTLEERGYGV